MWMTPNTVRSPGKFRNFQKKMQFVSTFTVGIFPCKGAKGFTIRYISPRRILMCLTGTVGPTEGRLVAATRAATGTNRFAGKKENNPGLTLIQYEHMRMTHSEGT